MRVLDVEVADRLESVLGFRRQHTEEAVRQIVRVATIDLIADDPDNRSLEAAREADAIVSNGRHLLTLGEREASQCFASLAYWTTCEGARRADRRALGGSTVRGFCCLGYGGAGIPCVTRFVYVSVYAFS